MYENNTTLEILNIMAGTEDLEVIGECLSEINKRVVPNDDPVEAMRGGIRPTNPNL